MFSFASAGRTEKLRDEEEEPGQQAGGGHHLPVLLHDLLHQRVGHLRQLFSELGKGRENTKSDVTISIDFQLGGVP